jgi:hypothetical protein
LPGQNADGPVARRIKIFVSLQPRDFVVKLLPLFVGSRDTHREAVLKDADNGAFQFAEMIELRGIWSPILTPTGAIRATARFDTLTARQENTGRAPPAARRVETENCPAMLTMIRTSLRRSAKTISQRAGRMATSKQHRIKGNIYSLFANTCLDNAPAARCERLS